MGLGVVQSLVRGGFAVGARDILPRAEASAVAAGAVAYPTPAAIARECRTLIVLVVDAAQIEDVLFGEHGAATEWTPGDVLMVSSTVPPSYVASLAQRAVRARRARNRRARVGRPAARSRRRMTIMLSGDEQAIADCAAVFDAIAGRRFVVGARAGDAATFKVLNNQLAAANLAAGAEAMAIAMRAGLDPRLFVDVVGVKLGGELDLRRSHGARSRR